MKRARNRAKGVVITSLESIRTEARMRPLMRSRALTVFAAVVVSAIVASAVAPPRAFAEYQKILMTPVMMGINRIEAMNLNFINVSGEVLVATLLFQDRDGRPVKTSRARVGPGESLSLGLSYGEVAAPAGVRTQIRVAVFVCPSDRAAQPPDPEADPPSELGVASLEVFDERTGKSAYGLLLPAVQTSATGGGEVGVAECDEYIKG